MCDFSYSIDQYKYQFGFDEAPPSTYHSVSINTDDEEDLVEPLQMTHTVDQTDTYCGLIDTDHDGHIDAADNCPSTFNPGQEDFDSSEGGPDGLIVAGVGHFAATYNEYKQTGDWNAASKNQGVTFNYSFETDFGYDSVKPNGVTQSEPVVTLKSGNDGRNEQTLSNFEVNASKFVTDTYDWFLEHQLVEFNGVANSRFICRYRIKTLF